jgi:hypothetical protein
MAKLLGRQNRLADFFEWRECSFLRHAALKSKRPARWRARKQKARRDCSGGLVLDMD